MKKEIEVKSIDDLPLEALIHMCKVDKYKISYATIRWAKEIKQKENLPDPVMSLVPRALRDILNGKTTLKDIEKLPMAVKMAPAPAPVPTTPTITLNVSPDDEKVEPEKE